MTDASVPFLFGLIDQTYRSGVSVIVRTRISAAAVGPTIEKVIHELDPDLPIYGVHTLADQVNSSPAGLMLFRTGAIIAGAQGLIVLLLAGSGIFGLVAFAVVRRGNVHSVVRASKPLVDRMDTSVGPFRIEIIEPLRRVRFVLPEAPAFRTARRRRNGRRMDLRWNHHSRFGGRTHRRLATRAPGVAHQPNRGPQIRVTPWWFGRQQVPRDRKRLP